jgi:hypothetical protein
VQYLTTSLFLSYLILFYSFGSDTSVFFSAALTGSDAFDQPQQMVRDLWRYSDNTDGDDDSDFDLTQKDVKDFANKKIHELTDGGWTDPHGVATAVAAGATEVFVVVADYSPRSIEYYFSTNKVMESLGAEFLQVEQQELVSNVNVTRYSYLVLDAIIFQQDYTVAQQAMANAPPILLPDKVQHLTRLVYATMLVTTAQNERFGIEANQDVTLHIFHPESKLTIGLMAQDFSDYGSLVADIVLTLQDPRNDAIVEDMLAVLML